MATLRSVLLRAREEWIGFLAAAVAYYALVSIVPLTALVALVVATVAGDAVAEWVLAAFGDTLSTAGREAIRRVLTTATARSQATVLGLVVLLWGGSRLFRGLDRAFGRIYRTDDGVDTVGHARDTVLALIGVLSMVVAVATVGAIAFAVAAELGELRSLADLSAAVGGMTDGAVGVVARVVLLCVLLFPVYYVLPNVSVTVREAVPGTVLAAVGWTALFAGFDLYVSLASGSALSGVLGGVVVVVTLLYAASFLLLVGAVVNAVLAEG
ncbi:YihY/virulence factor BrkB family protein [Halobaculum sp. WSA2]|uniref:YihY/virulence factor BrkB family protein n=1 Tax=Halobaculum saliterrae TaxID=2073113 RepID=A0A6B0SQI1_9EURY|nr:YihY/virulence factor BrkB family protein [Halobaculum saliterrae]MXR40945.1 YihY/virulence factor BrkB family protein [Halobaculum saliterrae]